MDEEAARQAWISYSTPLWKRAGRSDAWIAQNIQTEWATSKQDILRRYLAGDFGYVPEPPPPPRVEYKCPSCGRVFPSKPDLEAHLAEAHREPAPPPPKPTLMALPIEVKPTFIAPALAPTAPYVAPKPQPEPAPSLISTPTIQATLTERIVTPTITSTISSETLGPKEEPKMTLEGIGIPIARQPITGPALASQLISQAGIPKPSSQDEARALMGWLIYSIPIWQRAGYKIWEMATAADVWNTEAGKADVIRRYKANDFAGVGFPYEPPYEPPPPDEKPYEPPTIPTDWFRRGYEPPTPPAPKPTEDVRVNEMLDTYEQQILQLEQAFDEARAAELYTNPYAIICQHGETLLTQMQKFGPISVNWSLQQKIRLQSLILRLKNFITNSRTAATERKPLLTATEAVQQTETAWITKYLQQSQQTGTPGLISMYPVPGQYPVNGKPLVPTGPTFSPESILRGTEPQATPDYSVQERFAALTGQEPWELAAAELAPAPSRLPYYIMGGLGVVALVAYIAKKKKGAKR